MSRRRGQSTVELALTLPVLMLIVLGIVDFSRVFIAANVLTHATAGAARYASLNATDVAGIKKAVKDEAARASVTVTDPQVDVCYLTSGGVTLGCANAGTLPTAAAPGNLVQVTIAVPWNAETAIIQGVMPAGFTINSSAASTIE
jgi:Flp pilus assembly protein TadG